MKNLKLFTNIIHEITYILTSEQKKKLVYVLFVIIVSAFFELLGVTAILPFIQAVINPEELMNNKYVHNICYTLNITEASMVIVPAGIGIIFVYIFKNIFIVYAKYVQIKYSNSLQKELSVRMLKSYMERPYTFFVDTNSSVIKSGCNGSVSAFYAVVESLLELITEILTVSMIGLYLIYSDWITAIGTLLLMGVVLIAIVFGFKPIIKRAGNNNKYATFEKTKTLAQAIDGIKDILVMKRKDVFVEAFSEASEKARKTSQTYSVLSSLPDRITEAVCISGIIGIVCIRMVIGDQSMVEFVPKLALFAMAAFKILPSVGKIANKVNNIVYNRPLQEMVYKNVCDADEYLKEKKQYIEIARKNNESNDYTEIEKNSQNASLEISKIDFDIEFRDVEWKYKNQEKPVLEGFSLLIHKGESIGFVGQSGAGKTTAADVLLGLLHPQKGEVTIDGKDVYAMPNTWSRLIGYIPQIVFLIDDTIRANVAFGIKEANDNDIWDALERAQLKDFINSLPDKLDTIVGERGVKLSGGQRQRIAIARALYIKPQILVMDEATAALDNETENAVMESIEALQGNITLIIVAHRLTTIRKCDRIFEIKNGIAIEKNKQEIL